jgi:magnesium transporter
MSTSRRQIKAARRSPPGSVPGKLEIPRSAAKPSIRVIAFGPNELVERQVANVGDIVEMRQTFPTIWIDIVQFGDAKMISEIGDVFDLHRLALEDAINTHQRPKVEEYDDHLFIVALMLGEAGSLETEQVAFFVGSGYLITFQEKPGDCFENVRDRIRKANGRIRSAGSDYSAYALLDAIIDSYFPALERVGDELEALEDQVISSPEPGNISELHNMKRKLLLLRRAIWPHREVFNTLLRDEHPLISAETRPFLRDCYDHTIQLMDIVETYREMASGLVDVHLSSVSMKLNEVMKVLTIVATIFIPLSFIASVYGMNFDRERSPWNMPELGWYFGYPFALILMSATAAGLIWYIRKKGWLR